MRPARHPVNTNKMETASRFEGEEREIAGERIRDKIAASKKKGMWMGGNVPLGYDVKDRKLIINEPKAAMFLA
jgi:DNA invertase Pin-like site-specific DNA recombinase